jgi:O-antigen/teichoic acid export membrane protein
MEKAMEMGKTSATGSFQLFIGVVTSTIIMAVGTIILARLMTADEYGLYGVALIPATAITLFRDWGLNSAMTKYIANFRVSHKDRETHDVIVAGLIFEVAMGLVLSFLSLFLASFIASTVFHRPESESYIAIVSVSIISGSLLTASQSSFIGFERMGLNSFTIICQSIAKSAIGPLLVLLGYGVLGAVLGYTLSFVAAGFIGLGTFYFILFRPLSKRAQSSSNIAKTLKTMLRYGVPLSISSTLLGTLAQFYAFMIASFASNTSYGNYQIAIMFSVLLTFLTTPISTVLFPAFAKLDTQDEHGLIRTIFVSSTKYASLLLVPATMAVMVLSGPMIGTLLGEKYIDAPFFLALYVISNLFAVFGNLSSGNLLYGLGETKILLKQTILTLAIGLPLGLLLIPTIGIVGAILANILAGLPSMFWILYWIWKHYKAKADFQSSARIFAASTIAAAAAYLPVSLLNTTNWIRLTVGAIVYLTVYILGAPIIGAINQIDIRNLRTMSSNMGIVSAIINLPLKAAERVAKIRVTAKDEKSA